MRDGQGGISKNGGFSSSRADHYGGRKEREMYNANSRNHTWNIPTPWIGAAALFVWVWLFTMAGAAAGPGAKPAPAKKIPVIYDSDIGDDIDDTWALVMLLKSPELDLKLVVGDQGKPIYRASVFAKMLETAGRTDVDVGLGVDVKGQRNNGRQSKWIEGYDLHSYPGNVRVDGVQAIIDTIMNSPEKITVVAVGPVPNLKAALEREPRIAERARFVGMHGSVRLGYGGNKKISAEYNVRADAKACQKVFTAAWDMTITPLDTCGLIHLTGDKYKTVRDCRDPVTQALIANYRFWADNKNQTKMPDSKSSTLFDTVAVYLAFADDLCRIEELNIVVDDKGFTRIDPAGKKMRVATSWKDMEAFEDLLVKRVTGPTVKP